MPLSIRLTQLLLVISLHYLLVVHRLVHVTSSRTTIGPTEEYKACTCKASAAHTSRNSPRVAAILHHVTPHMCYCGRHVLCYDGGV
jgi:hypothetical protein